MTALPREMRQVLAELELISHGATQAWNSSGSPGGEPDDRMVALVASQPRSPTDPEQPPHLRYRALWEQATSDEERGRVWRAARDEVKAITRRVKLPIKSQSDREILVAKVLAAKGWTDQEVSQQERCTVREVRKIRAANGRDDRGVPVVIVADDMAERMRAFAGQGMSERQIALIEKVSPSTVRRVLGKAA